MSNYRGSNLAQVVPEQRMKTYPDITNEQVQAWWNAFATGAGSDESIGAKYDEGKNLYFLADDGSAVRALQEGEKLTDLGILRRLMENSLNGRLFTLNMEEALPRQVVTETNEPYEVGVSHAYNQWFVETPDVPETPPRHPGYLKYLLWPFSQSVREEFRSYKAEKAEYDQLKAHEAWLDNAFSNGRDLLADDQAHEAGRRKEVKRQEEAAAEAKKQAEQDAIDKAAFRKEQDERKQEWDKDVSTMSLEEFKKYRANLRLEIADVFSVSGSNVIQTIVSSKYASVDDVYDGLARVAEGMVNAELINVREAFDENGLLNEYLTMAQKGYPKMKDGLRDYVRQKFDQDLVQKALESHSAFSDETSALIDKMDEVWKSIPKDPYFTDKGLNFDPNRIPKQMFQEAMALKHKEVGAVGMQKFANDINNQIKAQAQPQQVQQVQMQVPQQQMQQAQPAPAPVPK